MCGLTAVMIGLSIAGGVAQFAGQQQSAKAQAEFQQRQAAENARIAEAQNRAANQAFLNQAFQENLRQREEDVKATEELSRIQLEAARARAKLRTSASESGLNVSASPGVLGLINDFTAQEGRARQNIEINREFSRRQSAENIRGFRAQAESRANAAPRFVAAPVQRPSLLGTVFQVGTDALQIASTRRASSGFATRQSFGSRGVGRAQPLGPTFNINPRL